MPLRDKNSLSRDGPPAMPVIIIGNGPSGICLSHLLSGYTPYLDAAVVHPNPILYHKLQEAKHLPITEQDLQYLCEGLEGRSGNPVAVLYDTLLHPDADRGFEFPSVLQWRLDKRHHIPHLILGKSAPGGAWHAMEGSMLTISLGIWMELPGVSYRDVNPAKRRAASSNRASPEEIVSYYQNYVTLMGLQRNFVENTYVTSVQRLHRVHENSLAKENDNGDQMNKADYGTGHGPQTGTDAGHDGKEHEKSHILKHGTENGIGRVQGGDGEDRWERRGEGTRESAVSQGLWEVRGYQQLQGETHVPFSLFAENVVLATGASDSPARLGVEGEELPYVFHSVRDLGAAVSQRGKSGPASDPVLVVGAGLSAADAILCACDHSISVLHAFRKRADDPSLIFKQLPKALYPEYHRVYHMMCSQTHLPAPVTNRGVNPTVPSASSALLPDYTSFPEHCVLSFHPDMSCVLRGSNGVLRAVKVSMVLVLIGTYPDLFFIKEKGQYLGLDSSRPISCKHNPVDINPYTFECRAEPGLFAMGPLVGDNFVRFLKGGALGIASCLLKRLKKMEKKLIEDGGGGQGGSPGGFV